MKDILLISEDYIKTHSLINDNTSGVYLQPAMVLAQEVGLQEIIGTKLLKKLKDLVDKNEIRNEENVHYLELLNDYITPYLLWETTSEILVPVSFKVSNSGAVLNTDDKKYALDIKDVEYLKEYYKDKARFFAKLMMDYLCHNSKYFKEYPGTCQDGLAGRTEDFSGIYFPDGNRCKRCCDYDKK